MGTALKAVGGDSGRIRKSKLHLPDRVYTNIKDEETDGFKKRDHYLSLEGAVKERADEGENNCFTILPLFEEYLSATVFHHFTM